jgi:hypothetical protein
MRHESLSCHPTQTGAATAPQGTCLQKNSVRARTASTRKLGEQAKSKTAVFDWFCRHDGTMFRPDESSVFAVELDRTVAVSAACARQGQVRRTRRSSQLGPKAQLTRGHINPRLPCRNASGHPPALPTSQACEQCTYLRSTNTKGESLTHGEVTGLRGGGDRVVATYSALSPKGWVLLFCARANPIRPAIWIWQLS